MTMGIFQCGETENDVIQATHHKISHKAYYRRAANLRLRSRTEFGFLWGR